MDVPTIDMAKSEAAKQLAIYRHSLHVRHNAEYAAIIKGYSAIVRGRKVIELSKVIAVGGADERGRPRLAVMRADQKRCELRVWEDGSVGFYAKKGRSASLVLRFPSGTVSPAPRSFVFAEAIVPLIPPQHMPAGKLDRYHILWEADWHDAPVDPMLIQHIVGDLWSILAVWDLTPLERAVISRTRAS